MKQKITFTKKTPEKILESNKHGILNFENLYSVYLFNKEVDFQKAIISPGNFTFPDGRLLSLFLKTSQVRGPSFTRHFIQNKLNKTQKHFFILPKKEDLKQLIKKFLKLKNSKAYSPPYIQGTIFPQKEINKMSEQIKKFKPTHVWVCIGNPKQEILSNQLYKKYPTFYFNVGAAIDFLLERKKESPRFIRRSGLESLYRLLTDFKYTKKKVIGHFAGLKYLRSIKIND